MNPGELVFETDRLRIRTATLEDAAMLVNLWTDPRVMTHVGFPKGLDITREAIEAKIQAARGSAYERLLIAVRKTDDRALGEGKLGLPNDEGIASTDVKLLPEHWGHRYGAEIKQGLVDYLFTHTDCVAVEGGPNVRNAASIKMQEAVGAVRVDETTYHFPEGMTVETVPVHHYVYRVFRDTWAKRRSDESR